MPPGGLVDRRRLLDEGLGGLGRRQLRIDGLIDSGGAGLRHPNGRPARRPRLWLVSDRGMVTGLGDPATLGPTYSAATPSEHTPERSCV